MPKQKRFYGFSVWSEHKCIEKLRYMHRNPVKRGLVEQPGSMEEEQLPAILFRGERAGTGKLSGMEIGNPETSAARSLGAAVWTLTRSSAKNANESGTRHFAGAIYYPAVALTCHFRPRKIRQ